MGVPAVISWAVAERAQKKVALTARKAIRLDARSIFPHSPRATDSQPMRDELKSKRKFKCVGTMICLPKANCIDFYQENKIFFLGGREPKRSPESENGGSAQP
jgi:hypothetical protein